MLKEEIKGQEEFRVLTNDKFIEWYLCKNSYIADVEDSNRDWGYFRNGYNFVILSGDMIYSASYFNKMIEG